MSSLSNFTETSKRRPMPQQQSKSRQHQYILPKYITASNGLSISRQLTKWIQGGHELNVLILRGPSQNAIQEDANISAVAATATHLPSHGVGFDEEGGGIPPYLVGLLQDLIMSKSIWEKIELSGKAPLATERILRSTMMLREGVQRNRPTNRIRGRSEKNRTDVGGDHIKELHKLVVEHSTVRILNSISDILNPGQAISTEGSVLDSTIVCRLALRWTEFTDASVEALSRGLVLHPTINSNIATSVTQPPLRGLFLTGSTFIEDSVPLFSEMLRSVTSLEELSLSDCHLEDEEAATIICALSDTPHPHLKYLDVSCNFVQEQATLAIAQLITQRSAMLNKPSTNSGTSMLSLDISNQDVWDNRAYLQPLMDAISGTGTANVEEQDTSLEEEAVVQGLSTTVQSIDWSHNFLDDDHMESLCRCFSLSISHQTSVNLQKLVLRGNSIGDAGVGRIAEALPAMKHLQVLDLRLNPKITNDGVDVLTQSIRRLHTRLSTNEEQSKIVTKSESHFRGRFLWHVYLDQPTQSFLLQLVLHRAGRTTLLHQEAKGFPLLSNIWPMVLERANCRCIQADIDSFDEEICIHGIYPADLIFELFRLGHASFIDCWQ